MFNTSVLATNFFIGMIKGFSSDGPILLTLIGSIFLAISLTGFRGFKNYNSFIDKNKQTYLFIGPGLFITSHHTENDILKGKEFRLFGRYFCTGCYGLLIGTIIAIILFSLYIFSIASIQFTTKYLILIPILFLPIVMRYTIKKNMGTFFRLISNILLPLGCALFMIFLDSIYQNWILNSIIMIFTGYHN
jgi:hypothetical protein